MLAIRVAEYPSGEVLSVYLHREDSFKDSRIARIVREADGIPLRGALHEVVGGGGDIEDDLDLLVMRAFEFGRQYESQKLIKETLRGKRKSYKKRFRKAPSSKLQPSAEG